ncbi:MAG: PDZ domain-containing protein, partial [Bacteroidia bacterium]|nr:PDZ domain-containing protein [Bacteroidia bacterium]
MKRHLLFISLLFSISVLCSQNLRRQVDFGAQVSSVTKAMATELGLENPTGVYISTIIPDGSAEVLEIREKDVLLSIGDSTIKNPYDYEMILSSYRGGDPVSIKLWRGGQTIEVTGILLAKTKEDPGLGQVIYDEVPFEGGFLRTITLTPSEQLEKMPAVLFIPSASCSSIDNLSSWHPYKKLLGTLTEKGMAVMRVEKSGLGDNFNTPSCDEISFEQEKAMYLAGLNQLKGYEFV